MVRDEQINCYPAIYLASLNAIRHLSRVSGKRSLTQGHLAQLLSSSSLDELEDKLQPNKESPPRSFRPQSKISEKRLRKLWESIAEEPHPDLLDPWTTDHLAAFEGNIENCIGALKIPVGIIGPLRVNGLYAKGDYPIPLATTEAALVASYHRGAALLSAIGGCSSMMLYKAINRAPAFVFRSMADAGRFVAWAMANFEELQSVAHSTTSHGKLVDVGTTLEGNHVYLNFEFTTGDASGQNMVTIATDAICSHIKEQCPVEFVEIYVEGNHSGDKKASAQAFTSVRGRKVSAEAIIPRQELQKFLHATPEQMADYWRVSAIGGVLSGTIGINGHFANGLAALYLATGQDVACVAESAMGVTRFETTQDGSLYASVTLPAIMVGTVGGGTGLPSQRACLELMNLYGTGKSDALAELCAATLLAGELSIIAALATGEFTRAHRKLARQ